MVYDIYSKHDYLNDILWKEKYRLEGPTGESCSIDQYFSRQEMMWSHALQTTTVPFPGTPQPPPMLQVHQPGVAMPPVRPNQENKETKKLMSNKAALEILLQEITQQISTMKMEQLKFYLRELQMRHKVVEDLSLDPDVNVPNVTTLKESRKLQIEIMAKIESKVKQEKVSDETRKQESQANLKALGTVPLPTLTGHSDYLTWKRGQDKLNTHVDDFKKGAVLLSTLRNPKDIRRCQGIYSFEELMSLLKAKYSRQEELVPALLNKLRNLPVPHNDEVMGDNIDMILNTFSQLKSISLVAIRRFDEGVVDNCLTKLTVEFQKKYEEFVLDNQKARDDFIVSRFDEDGSEINTIISGASREENRAPIDTSDETTIKRNMFMTFLRRQERVLGNIAGRTTNLPPGGSKVQKCTKCKVKPCKCKKSSGGGAGVYSAQTDSGKICPVCPTIKPHLNRNKKPTKALSACKAFREMPVKERRSIVRKEKACHLCLNYNHFAKDCTREYKCNNCQGRHNILLCDQKTSQKSHEPSAPTLEEIDGDANLVKTKQGSSYLAVSGATAVDSRSRRHGLTCLWDTGSTLNFILDSTARKLGYVGEPTTINLTRVGVFSTPIKCNRYWVNLKSNANKNIKIEAYSVPSIGTRKAIPPSILKKFEKMFKVHSSKINNQYGEIDLLMGIPNFALHPVRVKLVGNLQLLSSKFGKPFMVVGSIQGGGNQSASANFIDANVRDYIINDSMGLNLTPRCSICLKTPACKQCKLLTQPVSFKEQEEGKLIRDSMEFDYEKKEVRVSYPFLKDPKKIFPPDQSNYKLASKLATNLKKGLIRDGLLEEYSKEWNDMIQRGVIRELSNEEMDSWESSGNPINYCSHHAVLKDSKSTKCRIVTNSSLAHNGTSLNALMAKGPNAISNLLHVLLRFRSKPFLVIADLSKAYNSVKTGEIECHLRRFLWYNLKDLANPDAKLRTFGLTRMHFGDTPSGFFLESCKEEISNYSRIELKDSVLADAVLASSYVDDILPTYEDKEEAVRIANALPVAFGALGFSMKEVAVNGPGVMTDSNPEPEHLLGHLYHFDNDQIQLKFVANFSKKRRGQKTAPNLTSTSGLSSIPITKRSILSLLASQYDPLGLASPFLAKYKIFQAYLHKKYVDKGWDDAVDSEDHAEGLKLVKEMIKASESSLIFPRCVKPQNFNLEKIVVFSDGSVSAFQTVLYGIFVGPNGEAHTSLLTAKNRVTSETVPRAELCGIVAGCRLILNYFEAVPEASTVKEVNFLTDSTCCMDWLVSYYSTKQIYVINRVLEIRKSIHLLKVPVKFFCIPSHLNIADKGTKMDCKFSWLSSDEWSRGPPWIAEVENSPAVLKRAFNMEAEEDFALSYSAHVVMDPDLDKYEIWFNLLKTHNLNKVLRVWCIIKDIFNRKSFTKSIGWSVSQINEAFLFFVKMAQEEKKVQELKTKQLVIFEEDGILYTKMRFPDTVAQKVFQNPKLPVLSSKSKFGKILLEHAHARQNFRSIHAGIHQTLVNSRVGKFGVYITHAKQAIRGIINSCVLCRKTLKQTQDAKMSVREGGFGEVPKDGSCFNRIAIDYFGPYLSKPPRGRETRGTKFFKIWGMAVLCQQTRAIKVYPIEGYDTESFLTAFKIHCSNHGVPTSVLSDPMSAFISGAKAVGKEESAETNIDALADELQSAFNVEWTFIPPGSQWRDPAERAIKSIKQMMDSVFSCEKDKPVLTLNEYWCLFSEISEMLNRRPIQGAVFEDSLRMICPNDLILGRTSKEQPVALPESMDSRKRLQLIQDYKSEFWKVMMNIFASDSRLFKYPTWYKQSRKPNVNDIVLVLYKSKLKDNYKIAKVEGVTEDGRNLQLIVSPVQDASTNNFKIPTKLSVPTQRTILLYSPTDTAQAEVNENSD